MIYLPDTNVFIRAFQSNTAEEEFLKRIVIKNLLAISVIVVAEFYAKADMLEMRAFDKLILQFGVLLIDEKIAKIAGAYRKQLLKRKNRPILLDCFLAAQAKAHELMLVTNNKSDFPMKDIEIISP